MSLVLRNKELKERNKDRVRTELSFISKLTKEQTWQCRFTSASLTNAVPFNRPTLVSFQFYILTGKSRTADMEYAIPF
jgi:hypothetical protein